MIKILWMSVRLGIEDKRDARAQTLLSVAGVIELYTHGPRATNLPRGVVSRAGTAIGKIESRGQFGVLYVRPIEERARWLQIPNDDTRWKNT
jgi:hypothetical protein